MKILLLFGVAATLILRATPAPVPEQQVGDVNFYSTRSQSFEPPVVPNQGPLPGRAM